MRAILLVIILLGPSAIAQASALEMTGVGSVQAEGALPTEADGWVFRLRDLEEPVISTLLHVEAEWMRVEIDRRVEPVSTPIAGGPDALYSENGTILAYEGPGTIAATDHRVRYSILVDAKNAAGMWNTTAFEAKIPPRREYETHTTGATVREVPRIDTAGGVAVSAPTGRLRASGDMNFSAYDVDFRIDTPDGSIDVWTGQRNTPYHDALAPAPWGHMAEMQQAWVFLRNATLSTSLPDDAHSFYMWDSTTVVEDEVTLSGGSLSSPRVHQGPLEMQLRNVRNSLQVSIDDLDDVDAPGGGSDPLEGSPGKGAGGIGPNSVIPVPVASSWPWLLMSAMLILLAPVGVLLWTRTRWHSIESALDFGLYDIVLKRSRPFLRRGRKRVQASIFHAMGLLHSQGPDAAEAFLSAGNRATLLEKGTRHYLFALIRGFQGRLLEARDEVQACLDDEPAYAVEIERNPLLRGLLTPAADEAYA